MMNRNLRSLFYASGVALCLAGLHAADADEHITLEPARRDATAICTDGKSHYVALAPHDIMNYEMFYGDGKHLYQVPPPPPRTLNGLHFLDPRTVSKNGNPDFRGLDIRVWSEVEYDAAKRTCAVRCGDRVTKLTVLDPEKTRTLLKSAVFEPSPMQYKPYALVRDDLGFYYYVDRGATAKNQGSFRLFRGPKGDLKREQMTNVVSDSEGDIFATKSGSLRLILGRGESQWVEEQKRTKLTIVPVEKNMQLIYNDLGVYAGQTLGTPCDNL